MKVNRSAGRRTQASRTAATREALIVAARRLFAERGFNEVGTEEIARAAGVTRGALYHQFADKTGLFAEVLEAIEVDLTARLIEVVDAVAAGGGQPLDLLIAGADAWLDASSEPEVRRIALIDGPAVLGWSRWRDVGMRHGHGLVKALLTELMDGGGIPQQPVDPLADVLVGALDEAALFVALSDDPAQARIDAGAVLGRFVRAVTASP